MKVAIVGGGISGLSAAWRLREGGAEVVVLEADDRPGGKIGGEAAGGWLAERGPNGFLDSRLPVLQLAKDVGLEDQLVRASEAAEHRFLFLRGELRAIPTSPPKFLKSNLLPFGARMRMLREPFVPARRDSPEESVYDFAARRIGPEAAETLVDPMVTGVYAGDVRKLSLPAAFPKLYTLEKEHGGLFRGMLAKRKEKGAGGPSGPAGRLTSFAGGLSLFTDTMAKGLPVQTGRPATGVSREGDTWVVAAAGGDPVRADAVVFCTPTDVTARLVGGIAPAAVEPLLGVPYAPAGVVAVGYRVEDLPRPLDGFGYLIPSREGRRLLGVLWSSTLFPGRAPEGHALLRVIIGGARSPELLDLADDDLLTVVTEELRITLGGALPAPAFQRIVRWPRGIPQYTLGHLDRVAAAEEALAAWPGLYLGGNGLYGVSLADCVARADALPRILLR